MVAADGCPLRHDLSAGPFMFNWRTSKAWAECRPLRWTLAEGSRIFPMFRLNEQMSGDK